MSAEAELKLKKERDALGRVRTTLSAQIAGCDDRIREAEFSIEVAKRTKRSLVEEFKAVDRMLDLMNPYRPWPKRRPTP